MQEITQGEYVELVLKLEDKKAGRAFNLTGYDTFKVCVENNDNGFVAITEAANANSSVVTKDADDSLGEITAQFFSLDSTEFKVEEELDVMLEISKSADSPSKPLRKVFRRGLYVVPFEC